MYSKKENRSKIPTTIVFNRVKAVSHTVVLSADEVIPAASVVVTVALVVATLVIQMAIVISSNLSLPE